MEIAAHKDIARRFLSAVASTDANAMRSLLSPDVHLILRIAGVYSPELKAFPEGIQFDREQWIRREIDLQKDLRGPLSLKILSIIGEGDQVAVEVVVKGLRATTGRQYLQHYSYHFRTTEREIVEARLYQDTLHYWDVWTNRDTPRQSRNSETWARPFSGEWTEHTANTKAEIGKTNLVSANKETVRRFLMTVPMRDPATARAMWAPDGVWSFAVAGDYSAELRAFRGAPRWDREAMINMQQNSQSDFKEPLTLDIYSMTAEDNEVSVEAVGFLVRADSRAYRQHYSVHFKLRDGKLIEGHVYQDTLHQYDLSLQRANYTPVLSPISVP